MSAKTASEDLRGTYDQQLAEETGIHAASQHSLGPSDSTLDGPVGAALLAPNKLVFTSPFGEIHPASRISPSRPQVPASTSPQVTSPGVTAAAGALAAPEAQLYTAVLGRKEHPSNSQYERAHWRHPLARAAEQLQPPGTSEVSPGSQRASTKRSPRRTQALAKQVTLESVDESLRGMASEVLKSQRLPKHALNPPARGSARSRQRAAQTSPRDPFSAAKQITFNSLVSTNLSPRGAAAAAAGLAEPSNSAEHAGTARAGSPRPRAPPAKPAKLPAVEFSELSMDIQDMMIRHAYAAQPGLLPEDVQAAAEARLSRLREQSSDAQTQSQDSTDDAVHDDPEPWIARQWGSKQAVEELGPRIFEDGGDTPWAWWRQGEAEDSVAAAAWRTVQQQDGYAKASGGASARDALSNRLRKQMHTELHDLEQQVVHDAGSTMQLLHSLMDRDWRPSELAAGATLMQTHAELRDVLSSAQRSRRPYTALATQDEAEDVS